ncbi:type II secretion system F family protein [Agromyces sp. SYSU T00194]|uniref:type II secretion system F family protein n=1 Tax=Agromyces chitinivorans TaxID=3158560 RepID=UPI003398C929
MTPAFLLLGTLLVLFALLALVLFVIAPPAPRVSLERRLAPGEQHVSSLSKATDRTVAGIETILQRRRAGMFSEEVLELAGVRMQPSAFLLMVFSFSMVLAALGVLLGLGSIAALLFAILFGLMGPLLAKLWLSLRTSRRRAKFADQLDDTLQLLAGNLRAGHGLTQAMSSVARDADSPTSEEFSRVVNETRLGRDLNIALEATSARMQSDDFDWVTQAIAINRETGGNLAETLLRASATIRERNQIKRQVSALSAEGRLSAVVLVLLPIGVFGFLAITSPGYVAPFVQSVFGIAALVLAVLLLIAGTVWMIFAVRVKF